MPASRAADPSTTAIAALFELLNREAAAEFAASESEDRWSPWNRTDAWRLNRRARDVLRFVEGDEEVEVVVCFEDRGYRLHLPGGSVHARGSLGPNGLVEASLDGVEIAARVVASGRERWIILEGRTHRLALKDPGLPSGRSRHTSGRIIAPMPGKVSAVQVRAGDRVRSGRILMVLEAMKMEHAISAERNGVIERVCFSEGEQVAEGDELLVLAGEDR